ncbi:hypothetical protein [Amycolatopsis anabasis]|uniref:hypothetical protein n=1 Tax=Amycolatopsis anabasis TaxID=1840409 RepID=UPI00131B6BCB|nr:hypothetical protein [Amycolatopsis anabasis]
MVLALINQGLSPTEAAKALGESKQLINYHLSKANYKSPVRVAQENIPWKDISPEHKHTEPFNRVLNHLEYVATGGRRMSKTKRQRLRQWYDRLKRFEVVLVHDPNIPPSPGMKAGGWDYVPRLPEDDDLIIRVNKYATMSDEAYELFRLPDENKWPEVV